MLPLILPTFCQNIWIEHFTQKKNFEYINILFNLHQKYAKIDLSIPFLLTENLGWYFIFRYCSDIQCALEPFHQFIQNSTQNINLSLNRTSEYNNSSLPLSFILYWNELWIHVIKLFYWNMKYLDVWKTKGGVIWSIHSFLEFRFLFLSILRTEKNSEENAEIMSTVWKTRVNCLWSEAFKD